MSTPQLTYNATSNPDPVQASPATGNPSLATLMIVASNSTNQIIDCQSIVFSFPVGQNAKDFSNDPTGIQTTPPPGWSIQQSGGVFTATPDTPVAGQVGKLGLSFMFSQIKVNQQPGTFGLTVTETTASQAGVTVIPLGKFPSQFIVKDLKASSLSVGPGGSTTLIWSGSSGATYVLQYDDVVITKTTDGQPLPAIGSYTVNNLQQDTTFSLVVTLQVPGQDQPTVQRQCTVTVVRAHIAQFNAFPLTLGMGATCNVSWETNADQCYMDPGNQSVSAPNGSMSMTIQASTTLTLTAMKGTDVTQQSRSVTVVAPVIKSFTATPAGPVNAGDAVTLQWKTQYATTVSITPEVGSVQANGSVVVNPKNTTNYVLTCTGLGNPVVLSLTVTVNSVGIVSFTVRPTVTNPGDAATLSWTTVRATAVTLNGAPVAIASGTQEVKPQRDTAYTLTCQGPNGPVSQTVTLVTKCVKITSLGVVCADSEVACAWGGWPGTKYSINWSTTLATSTELSFNGKVVATKSGAYIYVQNYNREVYTLTANGPGGPDTRTLTLQYHD